MSEKEIMMRLLSADAATLARVEAALNGTGADSTKDEDLRLLTYTEAAKRLGVARQTVYSLVKQGRLDAVPLNGVSRIRLSSVRAFANGAR